MECYHCASIHPELVDVVPEFADGLAAQYYVGHGAEFGDDIDGFTIDGTAGPERLPGVPPEQDRRYYAATIRPQVFLNLVPDHAIVAWMVPVAVDRTTVICDWLFAPEVVDEAARGTSKLEASIELFDTVNRQDFAACERTQPAMSSRAYATGGVLMPSEHHLAEFHRWVQSQLD
jgi:Rieske 2Fe-2S family protein